MDIAQAYAEGVDYLENQRPGSKEKTGVFGLSRLFKRTDTQTSHHHYLLPLAVASQRMRDGTASDVTSNLPKFEDIMPQELGAISILHDYLQADVGRKVDMAVARPWLQDSLLGLRYLKGPPLRLSRLPRLDQPLESDPNNPVLAAIDVVRTILERGVKKGIEPFEIATTDDAFMGWLADQRDPKLWHQIASGGLNWGVPRNIEIAAWIVAQPECDPATAAGLFLNFNGHEIVGLPAKNALRSNHPEFLVTLCQRADELAINPRRLALTDFGLKNDQTKWAAKLDALYEERAVDSVECVPSPSALFVAPFKGRRSSGWCVHSEIYVQRDI